MEGQSREKEKVGPPRVGWDTRFKELKEFEPHGRFFPLSEGLSNAKGDRL
jgi:hypothetical protein